MKQFYTIKEVADLLKENEPTLRYWEGEFKEIIKPQRKARNVRAYLEKDIDNLRILKHLIRDCGLTLDGARKAMENDMEGVKKKAKIMQNLHAVRDELIELKAAMKAVAK
jgi:DNA-binding transcriptional MerR regulator